MYGHMYMTVKKDFFAHGFWQSFFEITDEAMTYMIKNSDPYLIAKLASVEIWGSLFVLKQPLTLLEENVNKFITMNIKKDSGQ